MAMNIKIDPVMDAHINDIIEAVRSKQDEGKLELYNKEMEDMLKRFNEKELLSAGCKIAKSSWKNYIILPEQYIEDEFIPALKTKIALALQK